MTNVRKVDQQPALKLHYFDITGKGEPIRLFCSYAGLTFEDHRFASYDEFQAMKSSGKLAFGQVPMLEVDGKTQLVQTAAILRYLSTIAGLQPEDPLIAARVDAIMDQENDAFTGTAVVSYMSRFGLELDGETREKAFNVISTEILPQQFRTVENLFKASPTGWIAGMCIS